MISGWLKTRSPTREYATVPRDYLRSLFIKRRSIEEKLMDHLRSNRRMRRSRWPREHDNPEGRSVGMPSQFERRPRRQKTAPSALGRRSAAVERTATMRTLVGAAFTLPHADQERCRVKNGGWWAALSNEFVSCRPPAALVDMGLADCGDAMHSLYGCPRCAGVYFCDHKAPGSVCTNENTNLLLRQYFPHEPPYSHHSSTARRRSSWPLDHRPHERPGISNSCDKLQASGCVDVELACVLNCVYSSHKRIHSQNWI